MNALPALLTFALLASPDAGPGWVKAAENDGIQVFTRNKPGTEVQEVKAVGTVDAPPESVWKIVRDYPKYTERMPFTEVATVVANEGDGKIIWFYSRIAAPLVSKRDYTLKILDESEWKDGQGFLRTSWSVDPTKGPAPTDGVVRLKTNDGFWMMEPQEGGKKTLVTYYLFTDPGGSLPKWMVNQANRSSVPDVLKALRKYAVVPPQK
jgi:START domain-containing protein